MRDLYEISKREKEIKQKLISEFIDDLRRHVSGTAILILIKKWERRKEQ